MMRGVILLTFGAFAAYSDDFMCRMSMRTHGTPSLETLYMRLEHLNVWYWDTPSVAQFNPNFL